jgi:glutamate---cysteine ligase / carboxylate-amine ligase
VTGEIPHDGATPHRSSVLDHRFGAGEPYTLGVEEEFMLLDPETWDLVQHIEAVLAKAAEGEFADRVHSELMQSVVEITTPVCRSAAEAGEQLRRLRAHVSEVARSEGCRYASAGTHPFSFFERQRITAKDRYRRLVEQMQYIARRELIFGMHIHTAVDDADKAMAVTNALLPHIAEFLALSASSPFWRGEPTGLHSSRQMIFSSFPRSGIPPRFSSYAEYAELVGQMERTGAIADYTHIWWDVRVHAKLGTIELRICDAVTNIDDVIAITAYFQALVKRYSEDFDAGRKLDGHHRILTVENKFLAARYGLEARVMDLATGASERVPISELVRRTYRDLVPHARELGSEAELEGIDEILSRGNGADRQLRIWNANRDITEVVRDLAKTTEVGLSRVP